jgi:hypothetical protein
MQLFAEIKTFYGSRILPAEGRKKMSSAEERNGGWEEKKHRWEERKNATKRGGKGGATAQAGLGLGTNDKAVKKEAEQRKREGRW